MNRINRGGAKRPVPFSAALISLALVQPAAALALGVGSAELRSHLGEGLDVRVPVVLDGSEPIGELQARLLPVSAYEPLGLEAPRIDPAALTVELNEDENGVWLELRSSRRVNEPLVLLLVETRLGSVRIVHELALLLEPVPGATPEAPAEVLPALARLPVDASTLAAAAAGTSDAPNAAVTPAAKSMPDQGTYGPTVAGETLRQIAERVRPEPKYGIRRVMTALLLANPEGFDASRRPIAGTQLVVPTPRQMLDLSGETITATVGPRGVAAPRRASPVAVEPGPEQPTTSAQAASPETVAARPGGPDAYAGLRLSLRLSPASRAAIADNEAPVERTVDGAPEFADEDGFEAIADTADAPAISVAAPTPLEAGQPQSAPDPAPDASAGDVATSPSSGGSGLWWLGAIFGLLVGAWLWWRRRSGAVPSLPTDPAASAPEMPLAAAPTPDRPVRMRVVGGRKSPEVLALQQRISRLVTRSDISQRTLTLASAYLDSGNSAMAVELIDELEAQPRQDSA